MNIELKRQIVHISAGIMFLGILLLLGREVLIAISFIGLIVGSLLINRYVFTKDHLYEILYHQIERKGVPFAGWGPTWYLVGILLLSTFLQEVPEIAVGLTMLAVSDGMATIVGKKGKHKIFYNKEKTIEGTLAFILSSMIGFYFIGFEIIPIGIIAGIAETLPLKIDDNALIPIVLIILFGLV